MGAAADGFTIAGAVASICTLGLAVWAALEVLPRRWRDRRRLERYLQQEKPQKRGPGDQGRRTVLHIAVALRITEERVLAAAFSSPRINITTGQDQHGRADKVFLSYTAEPRVLPDPVE